MVSKSESDKKKNALWNLFNLKRSLTRSRNPSDWFSTQSGEALDSLAKLGDFVSYARGLATTVCWIIATYL